LITPLLHFLSLDCHSGSMCATNKAQQPLINVSPLPDFFAIFH